MKVEQTESLTLTFCSVKLKHCAHFTLSNKEKIRHRIFIKNWLDHDK